MGEDIYVLKKKNPKKKKKKSSYELKLRKKHWIRTLEDKKGQDPNHREKTES